MWEKLFARKEALATVAGLCIALACPPVSLWIFVFLFPALFNALLFRCPTEKSGFLWGFLTSFVIMGGVFYWVTYVIHVFGYMPWSVSVLLYLGFCGFGALNFPFFAALGVWLRRRIQWQSVSVEWTCAWFAIGLPALFTVIEFLVPKLFPWYICHTLYRAIWLTQTAEFAGTTLTSFAIYSAGSVLGLYLLHKTDGLKWHPAVIAFPAVLWTFILTFSVIRIHQYHPDGKTLEVALVQANIGSLEKRAARKGIRAVVKEVLDSYESLTDQAMSHTPKPELILWPETAIPFQIEGSSAFVMRVLAMSERWKVPLITGAYAPVPWNPMSDYNAAYLLEPHDGRIVQDVYKKNILLAFGEYMPLGETFPKLYQWFPAVSNFAHGREQNPFTLANGVKLGVTICYEDIKPAFFRKAASHDVDAMVNLTNDSWFGPTSEPYQHAALATFRSIETRLPLMRVTNTGLSFTVDALGRMSETTPVYKEGFLVESVQLAKTPPHTLYLRFGDWFVWLSLAIFCFLVVIPFRKGHASVSL